MSGTGGGDGTVERDDRGLLGVRPSLAWLAPAGLVLYVLLRVPFAIYFERLGSSPEDAGFGYTQLLAQSSVLIFLIAAAGAVVTVYVWAIAASVRGYWHLIQMIFALRHLEGVVDLKNLAEMSDADFESSLLQARRTIRSLSAPGGERTIKLVRLVREDKKKALGRRRHRRTSSPIRRVIDVMGSEFVWNWRQLFRLSLLYTVAIFVVVLPWLAASEADQVKNCEPAHQILGLRYGGQRVQILDSKDFQPMFPDRELLLLGGDSSRYVLFDCRTDTTIRMATGETIVLHTPAR